MPPCILRSKPYSGGGFPELCFIEVLRLMSTMKRWQCELAPGTSILYSSSWVQSTDIGEDCLVHPSDVEYSLGPHLKKTLGWMAWRFWPASALRLCKGWLRLGWLLLLLRRRWPTTWYKSLGPPLTEPLIFPSSIPAGWEYLFVGSQFPPFKRLRGVNPWCKAVMGCTCIRNLCRRYHVCLHLLLNLDRILSPG